jgi:hypothetical protein
MIEDIQREAGDKIVWSDDVRKGIGRKADMMMNAYIKVIGQIIMAKLTPFF